MKLEDTEVAWRALGALLRGAAQMTRTAAREALEGLGITNPRLLLHANEFTLSGWELSVWAYRPALGSRLVIRVDPALLGLTVDEVLHLLPIPGTVPDEWDDTP